MLAPSFFAQFKLRIWCFMTSDEPDKVDVEMYRLLNDVPYDGSFVWRMREFDLYDPLCLRAAFGAEQVLKWAKEAMRPDRQPHKNTRICMCEEVRILLIASGDIKALEAYALLLLESAESDRHGDVHVGETGKKEWMTLDVGTSYVGNDEHHVKVVRLCHLALIEADMRTEYLERLAKTLRPSGGLYREIIRSIAERHVAGKP